MFTSKIVCDFIFNNKILASPGLILYAHPAFVTAKVKQSLSEMRERDLSNL